MSRLFVSSSLTLDFSARLFCFCRRAGGGGGEVTSFPPPPGLPNLSSPLLLLLSPILVLLFKPLFRSRSSLFRRYPRWFLPWLDPILCLTARRFWLLVAIVVWAIWFSGGFLLLWYLFLLNGVGTLTAFGFVAFLFRPDQLRLRSMAFKLCFGGGCERASPLLGFGGC